MSPSSPITRQKNASSTPETEESELSPGMNFLQHLEELRWTLIKCVASFLVAVVGVFILFPFTNQVLTWPLEQAMAGREGTQGLVTTSPMGVFSVLLQIGILGGLALSLPFILYFISGFIAPGLTPREKKMIIPGCLGGLVLFSVGALFSYFFLVPSALSVSITLNEMLGLELVWAADRYYSLLVWMVLGMGFCFEFPLVLLVLVTLNVLNTAQLRSWRKMMIVVAFILSAIITPTGDPLTQLMVAVPLIVLYELSLIVCAVVERRKARKSEEIEDII